MLSLARFTQIMQTQKCVPCFPAIYTGIFFGTFRAIR